MENDLRFFLTSKLYVFTFACLTVTKIQKGWECKTKHHSSNSEYRAVNLSGSVLGANSQIVRFDERNYTNKQVVLVAELNYSIPKKLLGHIIDELLQVFEIVEYSESSGHPKHKNKYASKLNI